jgi:outer membrane receptor protein involved in Fe transport
MKIAVRRILFLVAAIVLASCTAAYAQSGTATLQGTVTDATGAVVPNAKVHITAQLTGVSRDLTTNSVGFFSAPNLNATTYKVTIAAKGFTTNVQSGVILTVGEVKELDVPITLSASDTTITVETSSNQVNTVDTSLGGVVDGKQTRDLPLNGRDWTSLATLNTGVSQILTQYAGAATATTRLSRGLGAQLTIGGNRPQQNSYRLDGVNINDYANGGPGSVTNVTLGVDAVQEFTVIVSDAPAQYGRMSGGVINSITRQGTNTLHGSIYDYVRNSVFDAPTYPALAEPSFRQNEFGGTIGGPILRNRAFFFGNYEGFRNAQGIAQISTVLSPNAHNGIVSCTGTLTGTTCRTTPNGPTQCPVGVTTCYQQLVVNAAVAPYLALYPLPTSTVTGNSNTGSYNFVSNNKGNEDFSTIHLDYNLSQADSLHATLLYDTASLDAADQTNTLYDEAISRRTTAAVEENHIFTARLANSFRLGYNRSVAIAPNQKAVLNPAVNAVPGYYAGRSVGQLLVSGLTTVQGGSGSVGTNSYHSNSYQLYDDASYVLGKHSITFGGNIEYEQNNALGGVLPNGEWNFGSVNTFLTNVPTFFEGGLPGTPVVPHDLRDTIYAAYLMDSWKFRNNVTVNMGVRYEMATNTTETANRLGQLLTPTSPTGTSVSSFFSSNPTTKNFEPRLGVAWDVFHNGKTVFSAASGIYDVLPLNYTFQLQIISSAPSYQEGRVTYSGTTGSGKFPTNPFATTTPLLRNIYTPRTPPRNYILQSNVNVQQQLTKNTVLTLGYITSHGVHMLFNSNDINIVSPIGRDPNGNYYWPDTTAVTGAARQALVLNPSVGTESSSVYNGSSLYNSLQTSVSYSAPRGITGKVSYTWSHSIDDSSSQVSGASFSNANSGLPAFDLTLDRGDSDFDIRQVFTANAVAPLPDIKKGGAYTSILRHWTLNNIINMRSGIPFTPTVGGDALQELGSQTFDYPDRIVHSRSCTNSSNLHAAGGASAVAYVDTSCFAFAGTYNYGTGLNGPRLGTSRRNTLDGPGLFTWTTGLMKDQPIKGRLHAQFQAQAFNVTNHTNYSNPASAQTQFYSAAGVLSSSAGQLLQPAVIAGRQLQFALKILF